MNEINLKIKGMMCSGCENRVKNAVENIEGVEKVTADHATGAVKVLCNENVSKNSIEEVVEDIGYEVVRND